MLATAFTLPVTLELDDDCSISRALSVTTFLEMIVQVIFTHVGRQGHITVSVQLLLLFITFCQGFDLVGKR
jgi:hypothetical protein